MDKEHHIWCNYYMRSRKDCKMCKRLYEKYPTKENMMDHYFSAVIIKSNNN